MIGVYTETLNKLIEEFEKLPGVGPKSAQWWAKYNGIHPPGADYGQGGNIEYRIRNTK